MDDKKLKEIEKQLVQKRDWLHMGEVDIKKRPQNSLLSNEDIDFDVTAVVEPISTKQNDEIMKLVLLRIREGTFDNVDYVTEKEIIDDEPKENDEEEVSMFGLHRKGFLSKDSEGAEEYDVQELFNEIESSLLRISDFNNTGFVPDVKIKTHTTEKRVAKKKPTIKDLSKLKNVTVLK